MPEILTFSPNQELPKDTFFDKLKNLWEFFSSKDLFTKTSLIVMSLILLVTPIIAAQKTNLLSHAGTSLFNNCTPIPSGLTQDQIQQLSQSGKVRWCNNATSTQNPIQRENALAGTTDWKVTKPSLHGEIQAYVGADSVNQGENVPLYVSTKESGDGYIFDLYRLGYYGGKGGRFLWEVKYPGKGRSQGYYDPEENTAAPVHCPTCITSQKDENGQETYLTEANWMRTNLIPTKGFPSGIYVAKLTETNNGYQWEVQFTVREDTRKADLVVENPVNTDEAYNTWGGTSAYINYRKYPTSGRGAVPYWAFYLSFNRPYQQNYGTGHLVYWLYPMMQFLEQQGYDVTYTTNNAIADGKTNLLNYKGFVVVGHDEYVSYAERQKLEKALGSGVNLAFFGGNDMYWQIRNIPDKNLDQNQNKMIVEYKDYSTPHPMDPYDVPGNPNQYLTTTLWRAKPVNNPEDKLTKAMYPIGGGSYSTYQNFVATNTTNWIFNGTNMQNGTRIPGILGLEIETYYPNDGSITSHDHITVIGNSPFVSQSGQQFASNAVLDELDTGNIIFNAGTISWSRGLPSQPNVRIMTNNILYRMIYGRIPSSIQPNNTNMNAEQSLQTSSPIDDDKQTQTSENPSSNTGSSSGISGTITIGPTLPVCSDGQPCTKPYQATIIVMTGVGGTEVTRFTSNADGTFTVALPTGSYLLVPEKNGIPRMIQQFVKVNANQFTTVPIQFDSGIR